MATDYDSPWKEVLDLYFEAFLLFFFPHVHTEIDRSRGYESLDKEFQQVVREAEHGRRHVDKLVKVWQKDGREAWVLIHVEVQGRGEGEFPLRMYVYNYRVFDRYNRPVVSLAVLADDDPAWRPDRFESSLWGCTASLRFPIAKLLDWAPHEESLEANPNPFATVVLAHLKTRQTRGNPADRQAWKTRLVRGLYERGFGKAEIVNLFRFIDWIMDLPPVLDEVFWQGITQIQEEKRMPFITTPERIGLKRGLLKGIESVLEVRFQENGLKLMPEVCEIHDVEKLEAVLQAAKTVATPDDLRRIWAS
jgi:hypothetical protein